MTNPYRKGDTVRVVANKDSLQYVGIWYTHIGQEILLTEEQKSFHVSYRHPERGLGAFRPDNFQLVRREGQSFEGNPYRKGDTVRILDGFDNAGPLYGLFKYSVHTVVEDNNGWVRLQAPGYSKGGWNPDNVQLVERCLELKEPKHPFKVGDILVSCKNNRYHYYVEEADENDFTVSCITKGSRKAQGEYKHCYQIENYKKGIWSIVPEPEKCLHDFQVGDIVNNGYLDYKVVKSNPKTLDVGLNDDSLYVYTDNDYKLFKKGSCKKVVITSAKYRLTVWLNNGAFITFMAMNKCAVEDWISDATENGGFYNGKLEDNNLIFWPFHNVKNISVHKCD